MKQKILIEVTEEQLRYIKQIDLATDHHCLGAYACGECKILIEDKTIEEIAEELNVKIVKRG